MTGLLISSGLILSVDALSGEIVWKHKISNTTVNTVCPIDRRRVAASDMDGNVLLLENMTAD